MATSHKPRKRLLVDKEVQSSLLRRVTIHWIAFLVCNTIALTIWIRVFEHPEIGWADTFVGTLKRFLPFFVINLALFPAFIRDTLKTTNRFAGPISRLKTALRTAANGEPVERLKFREDDFWSDVAADFNRVADRIEAEK